MNVSNDRLKPFITQAFAEVVNQAAQKESAKVIILSSSAVQF